SREKLFGAPQVLSLSRLVSRPTCALPKGDLARFTYAAEVLSKRRSSPGYGQYSRQRTAKLDPRDTSRAIPRTAPKAIDRAMVDIQRAQRMQPHLSKIFLASACPVHSSRGSMAARGGAATVISC